MKIEYRKCGDYLIPNLELPPKPAIGKYGKLRHSYLRKYKEPLFTALMMKSQLNSHLEEIDRVANDTYIRIFQQLKRQFGITEKLKAENQLVWIHMMNDIHQIAEDIVLTELIYN